MENEKFDINKYSSVYFIGIGGISMSALALILKRKGMYVKGYDRNSSPSTRVLEKEGIDVFYDFSPLNCKGCDLAIYTAAVDASHPEMQAVIKNGIKYISRAQLLGALAAEYKNSIAVAGTHGKSTTSGLLSQIFLSAPASDPTILVGAKLPAIDSTFRIGGDGTFVFEACEYKDSFLKFYPKIAVVLNVEHDHPDYFKTLDQMIQSFSRFLSNTGDDGYAVVNADSPYALMAARKYDGTLYTFSADGGKADFIAADIKYEHGIPSFDVYLHGEKLYRAVMSVPGKHNISNALAACACAYICGVDAASVLKGLKAFRGVCRRFEYKGCFNGASVYDDYAHHPDEIKATLAGAKKIGAKRTVCVFQPHTFSRLKAFFDEFALSFADADEVVFADVFSAREQNVYGVTSKQLSAAVNGSRYFESFAGIAEYLKSSVSEGELVIIMGAGDIDGVIPLLLECE